jgi:hypothetical protein
MSAMAITGIVFVCVFGAALLGIALQMALPAHHLAGDSQETIKLILGLIATMAALVLGLLVASAKSSYDTQSGELTQLSANVIMLDRMLALYGPETGEVREQLRRMVEDSVDRIWPRDQPHPAAVTPVPPQGMVGAIYIAVQKLAPQTDSQRFLQGQVLQTLATIGQTRTLMFEQNSQPLSWLFLVVLIFWVGVLFAGFGLLSARNATAIAALLVGALSVAGAVFLVLELSQPYGGMLQLSSAGLQSALAVLGKP